MALANLHDMTNQKLARTVVLNSNPSSLTLGGSGNTCSTPSVNHFDEVMEGSTTVSGSDKSS